MGINVFIYMYGSFLQHFQWGKLLILITNTLIQIQIRSEMKLNVLKRNSFLFLWLCCKSDNLRGANGIGQTVSRALGRCLSSTGEKDHEASLSADVSRQIFLLSFETFSRV